MSWSINRFSDRLWRGFTERLSVTKISQLFTVWQQMLGEARTRILLWYLLILGITFLVAIPAFRYQIYQRIDQRVLQDMEADIMAFQTLIDGKSFVPENRLTDHNSDKMVIESRQLKRLDSGEDLKKLFRAYLLYRLPEDESYLITFIDGEFYKSSPSARPKLLARDSLLMREWAKQTQPQRGEKEFFTPKFSKILYMVEPVTINGETRGIFVVAHKPGKGKKL